MPEHDTPDLHDLDDLFGALERDIAGVSSPRGAGQAMATARRRRRTTIGAIAAVAVLVAGGAAVAQGGGHDTAVGPSDQPLPPPTPLSAATLEDASSGWMSGWAAVTNASAAIPAVKQLDSFRCTQGSHGGDTLSGAKSAGVSVFSSGADSAAYVAGLRFGSDAIGAAETKMDSLLTTCRPKVTSVRDYVGGSKVTYAEVRDGDHTLYLWNARYDDRIGLMITTGASHAPDEATVARMDDLLVGALQVPATVSSGDRITGPSSSSSSGGSGLGFLPPSAFASALGSWPNGWSATSSSTVDTSALPCGVDPTRGAQYGSGTSLGASGQQDFYGFANPALADQTAQSVAQQLGACPSYAVTQVALADGGNVMVASSTDQSGMVVWLLRQGARIGYITIPGSGSPPPDSVSRAVAALIDKTMAAASPGVESGPPPQAKSVGPGAATASAHVRPQRAGH